MTNTSSAYDRSVRGAPNISILSVYQLSGGQVEAMLWNINNIL